MNTKTHYFFMPIWLLRDIAVNPKETTLKMIKYGIYYYAQILELSYDKLISQFIYASLREKETLSEDLISRILNLEPDYFYLEELAFTHEGFEPTEMIQLYEKMFENDIYLENDIIEFAKVRASLKYCNIKADIQSVIDCGFSVNFNTPEKYPKVMVNKDKLLEFHNTEKSERELIKYAVNLSILSLIGKSKSFKNTNKAMVFARAFGYRNRKEVLELEAEPKLYKKYTTETVSSNILNEVEEEWHVHAYRKKGMRGIYIAKNTHMDRETLVREVTRKRNRTNIKKLKDEEYEKQALKDFKLIK